MTAPVSSSTSAVSATSSNTSAVSGALLPHEVFNNSTEVNSALLQETQVIENGYAQEAVIERAFRDYATVLHELMDVSHKLSVEMQRLRDHAPVALLGNLFGEAAQSHRDITSQLRTFSQTLDQKVGEYSTQRQHAEKASVAKKMRHTTKKFAALSTKRAAVQQHRSNALTSADVTNSVREETLEMSMQAEALDYCRKYSAHQRLQASALLLALLGAQRRYHEDARSRLETLMPLSDEVLGPSSRLASPPSPDVLTWIQTHATEERSFARNISQRFSGLRGSEKVHPATLPGAVPPGTTGPAGSNPPVTLLSVSDPRLAATTAAGSANNNSSTASLSQQQLQARIAALENAIRDSRVQLMSLETNLEQHSFNDMRRALRQTLQTLGNAVPLSNGTAAATASSSSSAPKTSPRGK